jgi:hypothetical protein
MPLVCLIGNGSIRVYMYGKDHGAAHIHIRHGDVWCKVAVSDGRIIAGEMRGRQRRLVLSWVERRRDVLLTAWERAQRGEHPGKIAE